MVRDDVPKCLRPAILRLALLEGENCRADVGFGDCRKVAVVN